MQNSFVGYLNFSIRSRMSNQGEFVGNVEIDIEFLEFKVIKSSTIIHDYYSMQSKMVDDQPPNEILSFSFCNLS